MSKSFSIRRIGAALAVAFLFTSSSAALSSPKIEGSSSPMLFMGASFGPTTEVAIQGAIWDAEACANASQMFTCRLVGEPEIFPGPNPEWGRNYTAQVTLECTP